MEMPRDDSGRIDALSAALAACQSRFHNIIERNADGILVIGPEGAIRYANPAAVRLLERPREDLTGRSFGVPIAPGESTEIDLPLACGEVRVAEMRVAETEWEGQAALLCTLRDVSERKALEQQLRRKMEELAEADRRKDEFLAMLAHELRNPLAPIRNAVHILKHRGDEPQTRERVRELIDHEVRSLTRLVDDLLDVSRITTGRIKLRLETFALPEVIERAMRAVRPLFEARRQSARAILNSQTAWVEADPVRIEQILVNLLTNAAKYTDPGGTIELTLHTLENSAWITVKDDGMGIAPEMLGPIFELFQQAEPTREQALGGLGIGLTLARRLAQLHGGELTAQSEGCGKGSTFTLRLPLIDRAPESEPLGRPRDGAETAAATTRGLKILVVDDNRALAESLRDVLLIWGHECRVALDGPQALAEARTFAPDLILLDIGLPRVDGHTIAAQLRRSLAPPQPRLIAMSGYSRIRDLDRARDSGFDCYLVKPVDLNLLEQILNGRGPSATEVPFDPSGDDAG